MSKSPSSTTVTRLSQIRDEALARMAKLPDEFRADDNHKPTKRELFRASIVAARLLGQEDPRRFFTPSIQRLIIAPTKREGLEHARSHQWIPGSYHIVSRREQLLGLIGPFEIHYEHESGIPHMLLDEMNARLDRWTNKHMVCSL